MLYLTLFFVFLFGTAIGSFLNVVIFRLHKHKTLGGRSSCPYCQHELSAIDLIPVFSFLSLKGKCRYCHHRLSWQYPLVEFWTGIIFCLVYLTSSFFEFANFSNMISLIFELFVASVLIVVAVYDFRWGLILDKIVFPSSVVAFLYLLLSHSSLILGFSSAAKLLALFYSLLTAFGLSLFFLAIILITKGRGMGGGDFKLSIFIGLAFGWPLALVATFLGFLTGAIGAVMLILLGKKNLKQTVPFGPFLALGSLLTLLYGNQILEFYLRSIGL